MTAPVGLVAVHTMSMTVLEVRARGGALPFARGVQAPACGRWGGSGRWLVRPGPCGACLDVDDAS